MLEIDVLSYHPKSGRVKHIQAKSNHHYSESDLAPLRVISSMIEAENITVELWDWMDNLQYPIINIIKKDGSIESFTEDPQLK